MLSSPLIINDELKCGVFLVNSLYCYLIIYTVFKLRVLQSIGSSLFEIVRCAFSLGTENSD